MSQGEVGGLGAEYQEESLCCVNVCAGGLAAGTNQRSRITKLEAINQHPILTNYRYLRYIFLYLILRPIAQLFNPSRDDRKNFRAVSSISMTFGNTWRINGGDFLVILNNVVPVGQRDKSLWNGLD